MGEHREAWSTRSKGISFLFRWPSHVYLHLEASGRLFCFSAFIRFLRALHSSINTRRKPWPTISLNYRLHLITTVHYPCPRRTNCFSSSAFGYLICIPCARNMPHSSINPIEMDDILNEISIKCFNASSSIDLKKTRQKKKHNFRFKSIDSIVKHRPSPVNQTGRCLPYFFLFRALWFNHKFPGE